VYARQTVSRLLPALPIPAHCTDGQSRIIEANQEWLDLLGYHRDDVVGRPLAAFLTSESAGRLAPTETAEPRKVIELTFVTKDSGQIHVLLSARTLSESSEPVTLTVLNDLRRVRRAELAHLIHGHSRDSLADVV
jgi:PAS domain S-box-containing protein